ncbi:MAG: hypothetical protein ACK5WF_19715, partial [Cyclobacteriaceae bacterium]
PSFLKIAPVVATIAPPDYKFAPVVVKPPTPFLNFIQPRQNRLLQFGNLYQVESINAPFVLRKTDCLCQKNKLKSGFN